MNYLSVLSEVSWMPVAAATLVTMVIGSIWYHEKVFGGAWMKLIGVKKRDVQGSEMAPLLLSATALTFVSHSFLAILMLSVGPAIMTSGDGAVFGLLVSTFLISLAFGVNYLFENRTINLWAINAGYVVLSTALAGGIIGGWS
jgi:hypothetical protein